MRVLITGARAPVALHMARLLHGAGWRVHLADSLRWPLAAGTRCKAGYHRLPDLRRHREAAVGLAGLIDRLGVDLVIPTCEEVLHLARIWQDHSLTAPLFAPPFPLLEEAHDKFRFIRLCEGLGLPVPETRLLQSWEEVLALADQAEGLVFKPVWSRFATRTLIRPNTAQLAGLAPTPESPWVAQDCIVGDEICAYAVAKEGRLLTLAAYRGLMRAGLGASICFQLVQDAGVEEFVRRFVGGTGWTGQVSFDLIRREDGAVLPIECNPRATSGLHFYGDPKGFAAMLAGAALLPDATGPLGVKLAMRLYGQRSGKPWRELLARSGDVLDWPGDRIGPWRQFLPVVEIATRALRRGLGLQAASTMDIEWNGDQSSIS